MILKAIGLRCTALSLRKVEARPPAVIDLKPYVHLDRYPCLTPRHRHQWYISSTDRTWQGPQ